MTMVMGVSAAADGTVWCMDSDGNMYMRVHNEWRRNTKGLGEEITAGNRGNVWCRNSDGFVYKHMGTGYDHVWQKDTSASQVTSLSAGADGTLWVTNAKGQVVKHENGAWQTNPTAKDAVEISVGDAGHVCYRDKDGQIFQLKGTAANGAWTKDKDAKNVTSLGVGNDGVVWVTNSTGELWRKDSSGWKQNDKGSNVRQISAGSADRVWCVSGQGEIFHAESNDSGTHWTAVTAPTGMAKPTTYTIKDGDQLLAILRSQHPSYSPERLIKDADEVARLNGWSGSIDSNYNGRASSLKAGDVIVMAA